MSTVSGKEIYVIAHYRKSDNPMVGTEERLTHIVEDSVYYNPEDAKERIKKLNSGIYIYDEEYKLLALTEPKNLKRG